MECDFSNSTAKNYVHFFFYLFKCKVVYIQRKEITLTSSILKTVSAERSSNKGKNKDTKKKNLKHGNLLNTVKNQNVRSKADPAREK